MARGPGEQGGEDDRDGIGGEAVAIGTDERRMQVRAYNHWIALLRGRNCPSIDDLDPAGIADFGPNSVLLDFTQGRDDPAIRFLGHALRAESGADSSISRLSQVPARSLLSRLTDHYLQIIANRAPIGFEAEFVGTRGHPMMYRGILMPFSSDGETIDYLYGVINWKEVVDPTTQSQLHAELAASRRAAPRPVSTAAAWADGPSAPLPDAPGEAAEGPAPSPIERARRLPGIGGVAVSAGADEFVLLLARADDPGTVAVLGRVDADPEQIERAIGQIAG
ncbi:PAS domain-containing protein [Sphingomonas silueang]|uniref:PAS domain-containing protein n=1 Tax=Sphingomonas silueang TaxID=3156617 RepID=UPI003CCD87EC